MISRSSLPEQTHIKLIRKMLPAGWIPEAQNLRIYEKNEVLQRSWHYFSLERNEWSNNANLTNTVALCRCSAGKKQKRGAGKSAKQFACIGVHLQGLVLSSDSHVLDRRGGALDPTAGILAIDTVLMQSILLLDPAPPSPVDELHSSINVVGEADAHSERHCNRRDILCQWWDLDQPLEAIDDLISGVGRNR